MRNPPEHVVEAIQEYDNRLGLQWDGNGAVWKFTFNGRPFMDWIHRDGTPAQGDTPVGEALSLIKESDNSTGGLHRLRAMLERLDETKRRDEKDKEATMNEASAEAAARAHVMQHGPKGFVTGAV